MNLQPTNVEARTQFMLGAGCDGHVIRALVGVLSEHVHSFRSAQYPPVCFGAVSANGDATDSPVPKCLRHTRYCHPGIVAAKKLGWSQLSGFFCDVCQYGKVIHADVNREPVAHRDDCGALVCGDIVGDFKVPKGPVNNTKYKYAAVFVSVFGKYIHVYPLQRNGRKTRRDQFTGVSRPESEGCTVACYVW